MKIFVVFAAGLLTLGVTGISAFVLVMVLTGPRGGLLPPAFQVPLLALAWALVLVLPVLVARAVWRRIAGSPD